MKNKIIIAAGAALVTLTLSFAAFGAHTSPTSGGECGPSNNNAMPTCSQSTDTIDCPEGYTPRNGYESHECNSGEGVKLYGKTDAQNIKDCTSTDTKQCCKEDTSKGTCLTKHYVTCRTETRQKTCSKNNADPHTVNVKVCLTSDPQEENSGDLDWAVSQPCS